MIRLRFMQISGIPESDSHEAPATRAVELIEKVRKASTLPSGRGRRARSSEKVELAPRTACVPSDDEASSKTRPSGSMFEMRNPTTKRCRRSGGLNSWRMRLGGN